MTILRGIDFGFLQLLCAALEVQDQNHEEASVRSIIRLAQSLAGTLIYALLLLQQGVFLPFYNTLVSVSLSSAVSIF